MFFPPSTHDIFIVHDWTYDSGWTAFVAVLDELAWGAWRNWSLPWHDPAINHFAKKGEDEVIGLLEGQISMSTVIFVLGDMITGSPKRARWMDVQMDLARKHGKTIVGVARRDSGEFPEALADKVDQVIPYTAESLKTFVGG